MATNLREELKARKQAYVQEEILAAAARLFAERGYRAVTIDDISSSLGYTKSVVYYYFKNKNQVLWDIFNHIHEEWWRDMLAITGQDMPPDEMLAAMVRTHALNVMDRVEWTAIYFRDQTELKESQYAKVTERKREFDALFRQTYLRGVEKGLFKDLSPHLVVSSIIGMCNATHAWYKSSGSMKAAEIADTYASLILHGCRT